MKSAIYMVITNTDNPGDEAILGVYPTMKLAQSRIQREKAEISAEVGLPFEKCGDILFGIEKVMVGLEGADTNISLR